MKNIIATNVYWILRFDIIELGKYHKRQWFDDPGGINEGWIYMTEQWMTPEEFFVFSLSTSVGDYESHYYEEVDDFTYLNAEELFYLFYEEIPLY